MVSCISGTAHNFEPNISAKMCGLYTSFYGSSPKPRIEMKTIVWMEEIFIIVRLKTSLMLFSMKSCTAEYTKQSSSIGKHFINEHCIVLKDLNRHFSVLKKCMNKFNCLVHEMLLIRELTPSLNVHVDSIQAKLFVWCCIFN